MIVLFNYCWGNGEFFPSMVFVASHVFIFATIVTVYQWKILGFELRFTMPTFIRVSYNIFNGLANLYCCNWIRPKDNSRKETKSRVSTLTITLELGTQLLFLIENTFIVISCMNSFSKFQEGSSVLKGIAGVAFALHFLGAILKILYYWSYYIWRNLIWKDFVEQCQPVFNYLRCKTLLDKEGTATIAEMSKLSKKEDSLC